jgi:hypothetical protein
MVTCIKIWDLVEDAMSKRMLPNSTPTEGFQLVEKVLGEFKEIANKTKMTSEVYPH